MISPADELDAVDITGKYLFVGAHSDISRHTGDIKYLLFLHFGFNSKSQFRLIKEVQFHIGLIFYPLHFNDQHIKSNLSI